MYQGDVFILILNQIIVNNLQGRVLTSLREE